MRLKRIESLNELKVNDLLFVESNGKNNFFSLSKINCIDNKIYGNSLTTSFEWNRELNDFQTDIKNRKIFKLVDKED